MTQQVAFIVLALGLLFVGAESLVRGSAALALRAGVSRLMVGLTIVAFGTSSPELVVSLEAALSRQGDIAVGNVVGSNAFNIGVILGLAALVCPIPVHRQIIKIDAPIALIELATGATLHRTTGNRKPFIGVDVRQGLVLVPHGKTLKVLTVAPGA